MYPPPPHKMAPHMPPMHQPHLQHPGAHPGAPPMQSFNVSAPQQVPPPWNMPPAGMCAYLYPTSCLLVCCLMML
jgi:hypothetical protein